MFEKVKEDENREILVELKNSLLLIITVIDLVFIFLSTIYSFNDSVEILFANFDFLVCILLFIDLMYDFYKSEDSFKEFFINRKNIISLISLFPFDMLFRYFAIFRMFRFLKLIKIVRIYNVRHDIHSLYYFIHYHLFKILFLILMVYIAISSVLLIVLEDSVNNMGDAFYFIVVTATTVGYGDIVPLTPGGKALAILTILVGIVFVAVLTAYLTTIYNQKEEMETREAFRKASDKVNNIIKSNKKEINELNKKLDQISEENKELHQKIDKLNENINKLMKK